jgi:predicted nicotinamide N-methyase
MVELLSGRNTVATTITGTWCEQTSTRPRVEHGMVSRPSWRAATALLGMAVNVAAVLPGNLARRTVRVDLGRGVSVGVVEVADWEWWDRESNDESSHPFFAKLWPAAVAISQHLVALPENSLCGMTVLELGCGNGLCSLAAASVGADSVLATDRSPDALVLTREAAAVGNLPIATELFDLASQRPLPEADLVVCADLLYDEHLAELVAIRTVEAMRRGSWVLVADCRRGPRHSFLKKMHELVQGTTFEFDESRTVALPAVGWKAKHVDILSLNAPFAQV